MREIFKELFGNERIKETVGESIVSGTASHAYIIEGPRGTGKRTLAREFAAALSCENRTNDRSPLPCGVCPTCKRILRDISSDYIHVTKEDKATIGVGKIREIRETLYVTPNDSDGKVYVIEEADKMTTEAQNALLISLEEPPPFVTFFLLTENPESLLDTVKSRSVTLRTEVFEKERIAEYLGTLPGADNMRKRSPEKFDEAIKYSGGSPGVARDILLGTKNRIKSAEESAVRFAELLVNGNTSEALTVMTRDIPTETEAVKDYLSILAGCVRNMIGQKVAPSPAEEEPISSVTGVVSSARLVFVFDRVTDALTKICANAGTKLTLCNLIFECKNKISGV